MDELRPWVKKFPRLAYYASPVAFMVIMPPIFAALLISGLIKTLYECCRTLVFIYDLLLETMDKLQTEIACQKNDLPKTAKE